MRRFFLITIPLSIVVALVLSCTEEDDCTLSTRAMMYCNIYQLSESGKSVTDTIDTLTVTAFGTDSVIINAQQTVTDISLPLRWSVDSTVFVFHYPSEVTDTICVRHTNTPYFLSMDCGYQVKQVINSVAYSQHLLDSIAITDTEANVYGTENLRLYY